ncbi:MAG TPA: winged helix-turn-helix domain-containing protein [Anaerolineae bacterium]|nr:winged helix-turn-helix domain-containing protein [Anaerolineae bacterium]HUV94295.1 winged helix-turn-helix domain-containing protein [Anaerolineae bacterium]
MEATNEDILALLREIRDLLVPISACFEQEYRRIARAKAEFAKFKSFLTPKRRQIFELLVGPRRLTQAEIASEVGSSQPYVSQTVSALMERNWIEEDEASQGTYNEVLPFTQMLEESQDATE